MSDKELIDKLERLLASIQEVKTPQYIDQNDVVRWESSVWDCRKALALLIILAKTSESTRVSNF